MKRLFAILLCISMALSLFAGCSQSQTSLTSQSTSKSTSQSTSASKAPMKVKDTVNIASGDLPTANPYGDSNTLVQMVCYLTHSFLVGMDPDTQKLIPGLALSWSPNQGNDVWTFKLRKGVKFHNGATFTAKDVKFTYEYGSVASKTIGNPWNVNVKEVKVVDDETVQFVLNGSAADFPSYCLREMLSKEAFDTIKDEQQAAAIGTGPYKFVAHVSGVSYSYDRFSDYYGEPALTPHIVFKVSADDNSMELALSAGDVDAMAVGNAEVAKRISKNPKFVYYSKLSGDSIYLGFNTETMTDVRVRKAVSMAINRDEIVDVYASGITGKTVYSFFSSSSEGYVKTEVPAFNLEGAKALLKEAGSGTTLRLFYHVAFKNIAEVIQAQLAKIGVKVVMNERSASGFSRTLREEGGYDMYLNVCGDLGGVLGYWVTQIGPGLNLNRMNYKNPKMDELYAKAKGANYADMLKYWGEMQVMFASDCPAVALIGMNRSFAGVKGFKGIKIGNSEKRIDLSHVYVQLD